MQSSQSVNVVTPVKKSYQGCPRDFMLTPSQAALFWDSKDIKSTKDYTVNATPKDAEHRAAWKVLKLPGVKSNPREHRWLTGNHFVVQNVKICC